MNEKCFAYEKRERNITLIHDYYCQLGMNQLLKLIRNILVHFNATNLGYFV